MSAIDSTSPRPISVRIPGDELDLIDAHAARLRTERPGVRITRTDAILSLLVAGYRAEQGRDRAAGAG